MVKKIVFFFFISSIFFYPASYAVDNNIRVLLLRDVKEFKLSIKCNYKIISGDNNEPVYAGKSILNDKVTCDDNSILIGKLKFNGQIIEIEPKKQGCIYVNNRRYRGNIKIIRTEDFKLKLVNNLDLEDYLRGVLRQEVSHRWPMAVLEAQAIAARTFALYQKELSKPNDFDVTADVSSQVYGGLNSETRKTNNAVSRTKGNILVFESKIFPTYYHATCGGHTEDASQLWNINITPLKGRPCSFCKDSPHFNWQKEIQLGDIELKLRDTRLNIKDIKDITIVATTDSGRISQLKIIDSEGGKDISAKEFRQLLGPDVIRSTNFNIEIKDSKAYFKGVGWGHGVGMCQWGAYKMAQLGYKFNQILAFYYPESKIQKIY